MDDQNFFFFKLLSGVGEVAHKMVSTLNKTIFLTKLTSLTHLKTQKQIQNKHSVFKNNPIGTANQK